MKRLDQRVCRTAPRLSALNDVINALIYVAATNLYLVDALSLCAVLRPSYRKLRLRAIACLQRRDDQADSPARSRHPIRESQRFHDEQIARQLIEQLLGCITNEHAL